MHAYVNTLVFCNKQTICYCIQTNASCLVRNKSAYFKIFSEYKYVFILFCNAVIFNKDQFEDNFRI